MSTCKNRRAVMENENVSSLHSLKFDGDLSLIYQLYNAGFKPIEIILSGKNYDGAVYVSDIEYVQKLQKFVYILYARATRPSHHSQTLSPIEKNKLKIQFSVTKGSSHIKIDLGGIPEKISAALEKLSGKDIKTIIIIAMVLGFTGFGMKTYIEAVKEIRIAQEQKSTPLDDKGLERFRSNLNLISQLNDEELQTLETIRQISSQNYNMRELSGILNDLHNSLLRTAIGPQKSDLNGITITGPKAIELLQAETVNSVVVNLDGHYEILSISEHEKDHNRTVYLLKLKSLLNKNGIIQAEYVVQNTETYKLEALSNSFINKIPLEYKILGRLRSDKIVYAEIMHVSDIESAAGD